MGSFQTQLDIVLGAGAGPNPEPTEGNWDFFGFVFV